MKNLISDADGVVEMEDDLDLGHFPGVRNSYNAHLFPKSYEKGGGVGLTVPNEGLSIREILSRYARGIPFSGPVRNPQYDADDDSVYGEEGMPDLRGMDYTEIQELYEQTTDRINLLRSQLKEMEDAKNKSQESA